MLATEQKTLTDFGLRVSQGMTTPSRPGKQPRPVWAVSGITTGYEEIFRQLGGNKWRGAWSFWEDPTDDLLEAISTQGRTSYAERLETKQERAEERAERYETYADNASARATAAFDKAHKIGELIPFGQPILVGHHSERHARADAARIDNSMRRGVEESKKADYFERRASAARKTAEGSHSVGFMQMRIEEAEATIRDLDRKIPQAETMQHAEWLGRLQALRQDAVEKRDYWQAELTAAGGVEFNKDNLKIGDIVLTKWGPCTVVRCNPKTATVQPHNRAIAYMGTMKMPYAEITGKSE